MSWETDVYNSVNLTNIALLSSWESSTLHLQVVLTLSSNATSSMYSFKECQVFYFIIFSSWTQQGPLLTFKANWQMWGEYLSYYLEGTLCHLLMPCHVRWCHLALIKLSARVWSCFKLTDMRRWRQSGRRKTRQEALRIELWNENDQYIFKTVCFCWEVLSTCILFFARWILELVLQQAICIN